LVPRSGSKLSFVCRFNSKQGSSTSCTFGVALTFLSADPIEAEEAPATPLEFVSAMLDDTHARKMSRSINGWHSLRGSGTHSAPTMQEGVSVACCLDYTNGPGVFTVSGSNDEKEFVVVDDLPPGAVPFISVMGVGVAVETADLVSAGSLVKSARKG
jgi:hypothetical protein